jgi:hypothetical protein
MATNPTLTPETDELEARVGATNSTQRASFARMRRVERQQLVHYALDLEQPPVVACETPQPFRYSPTASEVTCPACLQTEHFPQSARKERDITEPPVITANDVLMVAADLLVDANYDYTKAIVDMTSQLLGAGPDDTILMTRILRSLAQGD